MAEIAPKEAKSTTKHPKNETGSTIWALISSFCFLLKIENKTIETDAINTQAN